MSTFLKEIQKQAEGNILVTIYFYGHELFKIRDNFVLKHVFEDTNSFEIDLKNPKEQKFKFEPVKKMQEAIISQFPLQKFKNNVMKLLEDETLTFVDPLDQKKLTNLELVKSFEELGMSIERLYEILFLYNRNIKINLPIIDIDVAVYGKKFKLFVSIKIIFIIVFICF